MTRDDRTTSDPPEQPLFLDTYAGEDFKPRWNWKNLDTGEASQEFRSKKAALEAWRKGRLKFSRLMSGE